MTVLERTPARESLVVLRRTNVRLDATFEVRDPTEIRVRRDGESVSTADVAPLVTSNPSFRQVLWFDEPGARTVEIDVFGISRAAGDRLRDWDPLSGEEAYEGGDADEDDPALGDEVRHGTAAWEITVVDPDELGRTSRDRVEALLATTAMLYELGQVGSAGVERVLAAVERADAAREAWHLTALDEYERLERAVGE
jgi:hypothetical protein